MRLLMADTRLTPDYCRTCGKPISIEVELTATGGGPDTATRQSWTCPHGCGVIDLSHIHGRIVEVWPGHEAAR